MKNKRIFSAIFQSNIFYIWLLFLSALVTALYDIKVAFILGLICIVSLTVYMFGNISGSRDVKQFLNVLTGDLRKNIRSVLGGKLIPMVIIRHDGIILWTNRGFDEIAGNTLLKKSYLKEVLPEFDLADCINTEKDDFYKLSHGDRNYMVEINVSTTDNGKETYYALYFKDCTEYENLKDKYHREKFVSSVIFIDNYVFTDFYALINKDAFFVFKCNLKFI